MTATEDFYIRQAELCSKAAGETKLANQRDTFLRSQSAWEQLAAREKSTQAARVLRESEKSQSGLLDAE
jgi:hypothetical protein